MNNTAYLHGGHPTGGRRLNWGQITKWIVYSLLLLNFAYYFVEEMYIASHTLRLGGSFLQWTEEFATSIDELGWFGLLFALELETYSLSEETLEKKWVSWSIHLVRLVCYVLLAHTVLARITTVNDFREVAPSLEISSLCQLADQEISFGENYRYEVIDRSNCTELSQDNTFYFLDPTVITDQDGYELEQKNVWIDLNDAVVWILVIWAIELAVWLQNRNIAGGRLMVATHAAKALYAMLLLHAVWWAYTDHWVYAWDQFLWIAGFWAIERNLSAWRAEIRDETQVEETAMESHSA